jgi:ubiquinone/menaquinone biosynthesis C-methylase UbiE
MQGQYYDDYWRHGGVAYSGRRQGYAPSFLRWMAQELKTPDGSKLRKGLDAGCGDASFTETLSGYFEKTYATDISAAQILENRTRLTDIEFSVHDLSEALPFPDEFFDCVWCSEVLEHLFDPLFALRQYCRVLRPTGMLLVTVPYHGGIKNLMIALFKWNRHFDPEYPHIRFFSKRTLQHLTRKAGFDNIAILTCGMSRPLRDLLIPTNILMRATKGI